MPWACASVDQIVAAPATEIPNKVARRIAEEGVELVLGRERRDHDESDRRQQAGESGGTERVMHGLSPARSVAVGAGKG